MHDLFEFEKHRVVLDIVPAGTVRRYFGEQYPGIERGHCCVGFSLKRIVLACPRLATRHATLTSESGLPQTDLQQIKFGIPIKIRDAAVFLYEHFTTDRYEHSTQYLKEKERRRGHKLERNDPQIRLK
jgi:hypothetical protein